MVNHYFNMGILDPEDPLTEISFKYLREILNNPRFSLRFKTWVFFKYIFVDISDHLLPMSIDLMDVIEYDFDFDDQNFLELSNEVTMLFWNKCMKMWYNEVFCHKHVCIIHTYSSTGEKDVGLSCKKDLNITELNNNISGFAEKISKQDYDLLKRQGYTSLYACYESEANIVSNGFFGYAIYGLVSLIKRDVSSPLKLAHRSFDFGYVLKWKFIFKIPLSNIQSEQEYVVDYKECDNEICTSRQSEVGVVSNSISEQYNEKIEYVTRLVFRHSNSQVFYMKDEELFCSPSQLSLSI